MFDTKYHRGVVLGAFRYKRPKGEPVAISQDRLTLTVEEAAQVLGVGRTVAYRLVREGRIPAIRLGAKWFVPKAALEAFLASAEAVSAAR
jgi:excisionase family DNA binding protein